MSPFYLIIDAYRGGVWSDFNSNANLVSSLLSAICSPSLGICYFLLFLVLETIHSNFPYVITLRVLLVYAAQSIELDEADTLQLLFE